jgi:hypothetical protein
MAVSATAVRRVARWGRIAPHAAIPATAREPAANAAREGFLTGLNDILTLGAGLALAGALLALWLIREHEIRAAPPQGGTASMTSVELLAAAGRGCCSTSFASCPPRERTGDAPGAG